MRARFVRGVVLAVAVLAACGDGKSGAGTPPGSTDGVLAAMKAKGLAPGPLAPVQVAKLAGAACQRGDVSGVELTLCEFEDPSRAKKHEAAGLDVVGESTGSALAEGKLLLVVADRKGVDKDGKTIDAVTRAFRGR